MSYLFALIPAELADSTTQAIDVVHEIGSSSRSEVPESICAVLRDLAASEAAVFSVCGRPADARGAVIATHDPELGALQELLSLTKDRGVAVYDRNSSGSTIHESPRGHGQPLIRAGAPRLCGPSWI